MESCPGYLFESTVNTLCIFDPDVSIAITWIHTAILILLQLLAVYYFRRASQIKKRMTTPSEFVVSHDETYCRFSMLMIQFTQAYLVLISICMVLNHIQWWLPLDRLYADSFFTCTRPTSFLQPSFEQWYNFLVLPLIGSEMINNMVIYCQIFEWVSMYIIIMHQKNKHIGEILYEFNAENMDDTIRWTDASQINFRKKERVYGYCFIGVAVITAVNTVFT